MSALPVNLKTLYGAEQFNILQGQYNKYKGNSVVLKQFKERCMDDYGRINMYFRYFLENDEMMAKFRLDEDDEVSWNMYYQMYDMASCLKYFGEKP